MDHNPHLKPWVRPHPNRIAGKGVIERPGQTENIVWQTRANAPTEYENQLGDALERVFESGAVEVRDVVAKLNELGVRSADGRPWTEALFEEEMRRLASK